jgi:hypothetical protein
MEDPEQRRAFYAKELDPYANKHILVNRVVKAFGTLVASLNPRSNNVVLHVDDAHHLNTPAPQGKGPIGLGILGLISGMADLALVSNHLVVLTSTDTKLASLAPYPAQMPVVILPSSRYARTPAGPLPMPFTTLSYNLFDAHSAVEGPLTPLKLRTESVARKFGRPL